MPVFLFFLASSAVEAWSPLDHQGSPMITFLIPKSHTLHFTLNRKNTYMRKLIVMIQNARRALADHVIFFI